VSDQIPSRSPLRAAPAVGGFVKRLRILVYLLLEPTPPFYPFLHALPSAFPPSLPPPPPPLTLSPSRWRPGRGGVTDWASAVNQEKRRRGRDDENIVEWHHLAELRMRLNRDADREPRDKGAREGAIAHTCEDELRAATQQRRCAASGCRSGRGKGVKTDRMQMKARIMRVIGRWGDDGGKGFAVMWRACGPVLSCTTQWTTCDEFAVTGERTSTVEASLKDDVAVLLANTHPMKAADPDVSAATDAASRRADPRLLEKIVSRKTMFCTAKRWERRESTVVGTKAHQSKGMRASHVKGSARLDETDSHVGSDDTCRDSRTVVEDATRSD